MLQLSCPNCGNIIEVPPDGSGSCNIPNCGYLFKIFKSSEESIADDFFITQPSKVIKFKGFLENNHIYIAYGKKVAPFVIENILELIDPKALQTIQVGLSERLKRPMSIYVHFNKTPDITGINFPLEIIRNNDETFGRINPIISNAYHCEYCRKIRATKIGEKCCTFHDIGVVKNLLDSEKPKPIFGPCWAGLIDFAIPIVINSNVVAVLTLGQVLQNDEGESNLLFSGAKDVAELLSLDESELKTSLNSPEQYTSSKDELKNLNLEFISQVNILNSIAENRYWAERRVRESEFLSEIYSSFDTVKNIESLWKVISVILMRIIEFSYIKYSAIYLNSENEPNKFILKGNSTKLNKSSELIQFDELNYKHYFNTESIYKIKEDNVISDNKLYAICKNCLNLHEITCLYIFTFAIDSSLKGFVLLCDRNYGYSKNFLSTHRIEFLEKIFHELKMEIINQINIERLKNNIDTLNNINIKLAKAEKIREHETRAPLASIIANASFVHKYINEKAATSKERRLKEIIDDAEISAFLVKEVKIPSKNELDKSLSYVSPRSLILEVVSFINRQILRISELIDKGKINEIENDYDIIPSMRVEFTGSSSKTALNIHLFKRVLYNLSINAVKYGKKSGSLIIKLSQENSLININFVDDGMGIDDADIPHIFDEGYRGIKVRNYYSGEGLGLSIAKKIIEAHAGEIILKQNKNPTIFKISIPIVTISENALAVHPSIIRMDPFIKRKLK